MPCATAVITGSAKSPHRPAHDTGPRLSRRHGMVPTSQAISEARLDYWSGPDARDATLEQLRSTVTVTGRDSEHLTLPRKRTPGATMARRSEALRTNSAQNATTTFKCCYPTHVLSRSRSQAALAPALSLIAGLPPPASENDHRLRLHVFSNGGAATLHRLLALLGPAALPPHVAVFDSCPAPFRFRRTHGALATGLPWPLAPVLYLLLAIYSLLHVPLRRSSSLDRAAAALNEERVTATELRRTYVYSADDKMVGWKDVEAHADEAAAGGLDVRRERFVGSGHVAHARIDSARYWKVVTETFKKAA
ncbi:uncharacterized protein VDAG_01250 [Verticillium dahliae VdLs.17]|uniref:DUF829 domain-containing protein n=1 Tax=Verticillium dahliae (strain VdLs.17 / ATCC MYA-4575 / FGSC 10137) TaxID=498257 RepID=G2WTX7_VERDV|nr:uncharacterized protein VDAG_01250 [Verticillium dahliae VdLs.17]EGY17568.1 hypothetical protein VDAG_01250 [Verticillium dahliae VdLs.17]